MRPPTDLRRLPAALYLRLFGAAGLGYLAGTAGRLTASATLTIAALGLAATLAGWLMMRPLMRDAKTALSRVTKIHMQREENNDTAP
ncbi:hypothetical protein Q4S45_13930 [Massilia sp. R2A-15]|uniref:hypothetical protein n=1 Tax=Massilia sp. R2A-15 TaxID=3064278 RepID=UPI0027331F07|nr:hypothetical protein [Massilia sp. R2A-15]WLI87836.1 hypothetical protein Q4S45_13930 [Massilia sp. R2A-15]